MIALVKGKRLASLNGFTIHARTKVNTLDRSGLHRLVEYQARPPISDERIGIEEDGQIRIKLKTPYSDGTTHIEMTPFDFLARLQALIPPRFVNQTIHFGIFAPAHPLRKEIVLRQTRKQNSNKKGELGADGAKLVKYSNWAKLLARTFQIDVVAACPICKADLKITAALQNKDEIHRFLKGTGLGQTDPPEKIRAYQDADHTPGWLQYDPNQDQIDLPAD